MNKTFFESYKAHIRAGHRNPVVRKWFGLYAWFWFHTEFWLEKLERRPYTYIMRDWIYPNEVLFYVISALWFLGLAAWSWFQGFAPTIVGILTAMLWAHLVWGSSWIPGQQEDPQIEEC